MELARFLRERKVNASIIYITDYQMCIRDSVGQTAQVTLDGSFETLTGTVQSISGGNAVGTGNTITRDVTIAVQNPGGLSAVQVATASVNGLGSAGNGTFTYQSESTVTASASGTVAAVHVSEGSAVSKGQVLITLGCLLYTSRCV